MKQKRKKEEQNMQFNRRLFVASALAAPFLSARVASASEDGPVRNNISAFRLQNWEDHFDALGVGLIIADTTSRILQQWTPDGQMYLYPTSVPLSDELTRRGYTEVIDKRVNPSWAPTPSMRKRNPEWPAFVPGGDPTNPLGTRALYLSWQYYRIHGTQDTRKIGRRASNGCIGLYNENIEEVFDRTPVGTKVKLL